MEVAKRQGAFDDMFLEGWYFSSLLGGLRQVFFSRGAASADGATPGAPPSDDPKAAAQVGSRGGDGASGKVFELLKEIGLARAATFIPTAVGRSNGNSTWPTSQVMPCEGAGAGRPASVLAALAHSPRGSVLTVEEAEIHLDPAAQVGLAKIMVRQAVQEDKQILFTTHSDHLLYPLLAYVEKKGHPLGPEDVAIHCFEAGGQGEAACAERLRINEHGQVRGGLKGFWDVDMRAMDEIVHEGADAKAEAPSSCA